MGREQSSADVNPPCGSSIGLHFDGPGTNPHGTHRGFIIVSSVFHQEERIDCFNFCVVNEHASRRDPVSVDNAKCFQQLGLENFCSDPPWLLAQTVDAGVDPDR